MRLVIGLQPTSWDGIKKIELKVPSSENSHYGYALCAYKVNLETICDVRDYARGRVKVLYCGAYADGYDGYNFDYERIGREMGRTGGAYSDFGKPKRYISFIIIALRVKVIGSTNLILL